MSNLISYIALGFSLLSFFITYQYNRKVNRESSRYREALFFFERNLAFEGRIADWSEGLEFFGIDLDAAEKENITKYHIAFMIVSLNAQTAYAIAKGISIYDHIKSSDYRQRFFSHQITRKAWKYVKPFFPDRPEDHSTAYNVEKYLKEEYPEDFEKNQMEINKKGGKDGT